MDEAKRREQIAEKVADVSQVLMIAVGVIRGFEGVVLTDSFLTVQEQSSSSNLDITLELSVELPPESHSDV